MASRVPPTPWTPNPRTVNQHLEHVLEKLGVKTRAAAAAIVSAVGDERGAT